jgi:hypoxia up-regulated 1
MARLRIAGKKTKETLSANQETPVNVEALSNDIDLRAKITREEFNEMNQDIWDRALAPVQKLLDDTGMSTSDIHAAVIVGGSSLIPKVQEQLKAKLGLDELTRNLDAFESAALGAGFYAAGLSPSFRVREVGVTDLYPFGVSATVSKSLAGAEDDEVEAEESVSEVVFEPKEPVPNRKYLIFSRSSNFTVSLKYTNPEVMSADTETDIGWYNMTGVNKCEKFNTTDKPKITLKLEIDRNGMATVTEAAAGVTEWTEKSVKIPRKKKKTEDEKAPKKKSKKSKDSDEDESADGNEPEPEKDSAESDAGDTNDEGAKEPEVAEEPEVIEEHKCEWNATLNVTLGEGEDAKEKEVQPYIGLDSGTNKTMTGECAIVNPEYEGDIVLMCFEAALTADTSDCTVVKYEIRSEKVVRKVDLKKKYREKGISKMTKSKKDDANGRLAKIQKVMDEIHRLAKAKNDVEAHIFETRDMLEYNEELKAVVSDEQADEIRSGLSAAEEWMWEDYTYSEYVDKLYELRDAIKPALIRKDEAVSRPQVLARAHEAIKKTQETLANESYMELMPANETEKMVEKTETFALYVKEQEDAQAALSLTDEPAFMSAEIESKLSKYEKAMEAAMAKKPKPKKPKTKKAKKPEKSAMELVSYATNAEQFEILSEFYAELKEDKTDDDIQAILDKRKDEGADVLTLSQFEELCAKLKVKKFINPIELWAEKHPPPEEESKDESEEEGDGDGGGWFSGWGSGDAADDDAKGEGDEGAEDTESTADTEDTEDTAKDDL